MRARPLTGAQARFVATLLVIANALTFGAILTTQQLHNKMQAGLAAARSSRLLLAVAADDLTSSSQDALDAVQISHCRIALLDAPVDGIVLHKSEVAAEASGLPSNAHVWMFVRPKTTKRWWPQRELVRTESGIFQGTPVLFPSDKDKVFEISVVALTPKWNEELVTYLQEGNRTGDFPPVDIDDKALCEARMTVVQK